MPGPRGDPDRGNPSRGTVRPPGHRGLSRHGHRRRRHRGHHMTAMLEVRDLKVAYGKILAVKKISFSVEEGQVVTLIGTNGAGKTTTLRTISGLIRPSSGEILFQGKRIDAVPAHKIVSLGLAHSPEGRKIFPKMTIEENLLLGAFARADSGIKKDLDASYDPVSYTHLRAHET